MNKEKYILAINGIKEVIDNMPQNSKSNKQKLLSYLNEQQQKFTQVANELAEEINSRNNIIIRKEIRDKKEFSEENKKIILNKLFILNEKNSPYEKSGLDKIILNIDKYYEGNIELLNNEISKAILCFKEVGIELTEKDFWYSEYLSEYINYILNNKSKEEINEKLNEIYWKCPNIINQVSMNLNSLYCKYEKKFIEYYHKCQKRILSNSTKNQLIEEFNELKNMQDEDYYSISNISKRFIYGEDNIKDFSSNKYKTYIELLSDTEISNENLNKLNDSLYEYIILQKYKFLIEDFIETYKEKDKYKNAYKNLISEIKKEEKKILSINKKIAFQKKWSKNQNKIELLNINLNNIIDSLKEKYRDLQIAKVNDIIFQSTDNISYYDILYLIASHYSYLRKLLEKNNQTITDIEIDNTQMELFTFLISNKLTILNNITVLEEKSITNIIANIYKLLNIKIEENDIAENAENYVELIRKIRIINKINNSFVTYEELLFQTQVKAIVDSKK